MISIDKSLLRFPSPKRYWVDHPLFNFLWFYAVWLTCVLGREEAWFIAIALIVFHYALVRNRLNEFYFAATSLVIGAAVDTLLSFYDVFIFENDRLMPVWLLILWFAFPSTINRGIKFLKRNIYLAVGVGGFGGASSYISGEYFGAVEFGHSYLLTSIILFLHWGIMIPILIQISKFFPIESKQHS